MSFEITLLTLPDGYEIVETDQVIASADRLVYTHFFRIIALRHAEQLNDARITPMYRYEVEPVSPAMRKAFGWAHRWVCVPYQNVLRKKDEDGSTNP